MPKILRRVGANIIIMKKIVLLTLLVIISLSSFAQLKALKPLMTQEELEWNEETRDEAYTAPNSKFVGKKWYYAKHMHFIFSPNGAYKKVEKCESNDDDAPVRWTETSPGTWKRNKTQLTINFNTKQIVYTVDPSSLKNYSLRKQDYIKTNLANQQKSARMESPWSEQLEFYKITNDILILKSYNSGQIMYLYSEKKMNELIERSKK